MASRSDRAIVLRVSAYSETSQIVSLMTGASGRVRLLAKGIRRSTKNRFAPGVDLLELGQVRFLLPRGESDLGTLTEWVQLEAFSEIRKSLTHLHAGLYAAELLTSLTQVLDPHEGLCAALERLLRSLVDRTPPLADNAAGDDAVTAVVRFQAALLRSTGFTPNLRTCVSCSRPRGRNAEAFFSSTAGGYICRDCEPQQVEKRRLAPALVDTGAGPETAPLWFDLLEYHLSQVAGRAFNTAAYLRAAFGSAT